MLRTEEYRFGSDCVEVAADRDAASVPGSYLPEL